MSNITNDFNGKVALITGSSSGIGAQTAILLAKGGADVVITGRNDSKLSEVAKKCQQISPKGLKPLQVLADVTKEEDIKRLVETTIQELGRLDILVNNAGYVDTRLITDSDYMKVYENIFKTNLNSVVFMTHLCVEHLAKTKGNIVNISSISSHLTANRLSAYCMSKSALDMFTKCMAAELGPKNIRVNCVNPGTIKTSILDNSGIEHAKLEQIFDTIGNKYPVGRVGEPQDIANAILFMASEKASFITGTVMLADGGHTAANVSSVLFQ